MSDKWIVWYRAHGMAGTWYQHKSAIMWRVAVPKPPDDPLNPGSFWIQPEHYSEKHHRLLKFESKDEAEQWIIEEQLRDPKIAGEEMGAVQINEKGVVNGRYV